MASDLEFNQKTSFCLVYFTKKEFSTVSHGVIYITTDMVDMGRIKIILWLNQNKTLHVKLTFQMPERCMLSNLEEDKLYIYTISEREHIFCKVSRFFNYVRW